VTKNKKLGEKHSKEEQGGKLATTESAVQISTASNSESSTVVSGCRYKKELTLKAVALIQKKPQ
jgi:hypothetical protein